MDYTKSVVEPMKQVAPRSRLRGMVEDYIDIDTNVLVLAGETHLNRKPVRKIRIPGIHKSHKLYYTGWRAVHYRRGTQCLR